MRRGWSYIHGEGWVRDSEPMPPWSGKIDKWTVTHLRQRIECVGIRGLDEQEYRIAFAVLPTRMRDFPEVKPPEEAWIDCNVLKDEWKVSWSQPNKNGE